MSDEFDRPFGGSAGAGGRDWGRSSYDAARDVRSSRATPRDAGSGSSSQRLGGRSRVEQEFPIGCRVRHPMFGIGKVEVVTPRARGSSVQVSFASVGRKTLIVEFAKLTRVE